MSERARRGDVDDLGAALGAGLGRAVDAPVDTAALLAGAHRGARRIRRRRTATRGAVVALCAVAVLPLGLQVVGSGSDSATQTSTAGGAMPATQPPPGGTGDVEEYATLDEPDPTDGSRSGMQGSPGVTGGLGASRSAPAPARVPDRAVLATADVATAGGAGATAQVEQDASPTNASAWLGPLCPDGRSGGSGRVAVVSDRLVRWTATDAAGRDWTAATVVRVLRGDGAARVLAEVSDGVDGCTGTAGPVRQPLGVLPAPPDAALRQEGLLVATLAQGRQRAVGVLRVGRVVVGVEVVVPVTAGGDAASRRELAVDRARALLGRAAERAGPLAADAPAAP